MAENLVGKPSRYNETLLKAINVQPNETVLDIGCGPGTFVIPLAQQCQAVYALDYSQGMLDMVQQYKEKHQQIILPLYINHGPITGMMCLKQM